MSDKVLLIDRAHLELPRIDRVQRTDSGKTFDFDTWDKLIKDTELGRNPKLQVVMNATHSGTIVNRRVYPAKHMRDGLDTWVSPYARPVLSDHPSHSLFGGGSEPEVFGRVERAEFISLRESREDLDNDWKAPGRADLGSGFSRLYSTLTLDDAIDGVLSGRLKTVSTGQFTNRLTCSICGSNHLNDGCEHTPGTFQDIESDKTRGIKGGRYLAYAITGRLRYDHVAFVNTPANPFASVIHMDSMGNVEKQDEGEKSLLEYSVERLVLHDEHGSIHMTLDHAMGDNNTQTDRSRVSALIPDIEPESSGKSRKSQKPGLSAGVVLATVKSTDKAKETVTDDRHTYSKAKTEKPMKVRNSSLAESMVLSSLVDAGLEFDWEAYEKATGRDNQFASLHKSDLSTDSFSEISDALRKAIKDGVADEAFCGPSKSIPVIDEETAAAARRLMQYVQMDNKSEVDAAIEKRLNPGTDEDDNEGDTTTTDGHEQALAALADTRAKVSTLEEENKVLRSRLRRDLVDKVIDLRTKLKRPDVLSLDKEGREEYRKNLITRSLNSLENTIEDLQLELDSSGVQRDGENEQIVDPTVDQGDKPAADKKEEETKQKAEAKVDTAGLDPLTKSFV